MLKPHPLPRSVATALAGLAVAISTACAEPPRRPGEDRPIAKPTAAVDVTLDARPLGGDRHRLRFVATPSAAADALELRLDPREATVISGPTLLQFGATPAGVGRELVAEVRVREKSTGLVFGHTSITIGPTTRSKSTAAYLLDASAKGPPAGQAGPTLRTVTLPDGTRVAETRP